MMIITIDDIVAKNPCDAYPLKRVRKIANGRESIALTDAFDLDIPHDDIIWLITRFLDDRSNRLFAADVAEHDVARKPDGPSKNISMALIARVRDYAIGKITDTELRRCRQKVARSAAYYAAEAAAEAADAAVNAAANAAYNAVNAALNAADAYAYATMAYSVAAAEREWQLNRLRFYVDEMEK